MMASCATTTANGRRKGSDLRSSLQEVEEELDIDDEEEGEERQALKVANQFFKIEKGKQFGLYSASISSCRVAREGRRG